MDACTNGLSRLNTHSVSLTQKEIIYHMNRQSYTVIMLGDTNGDTMIAIVLVSLQGL